MLPKDLDRLRMVSTSSPRSVQHVDPGEHFFAALGALDGLLPVEGTELPDDIFLAADLLLLVQIGLHLCLADQGFLLAVGGVIAQVDASAAIFQLDDLRGDLVQEIPVVGHDDDRSFVVQQVIFKPGDAAHVQMVGGLVQKNDVGPGEQELAQGDAGLLASAQGGDLPREILLGKSEAFQHAHDLAAVTITFRKLKLMG